MMLVHRLDDVVAELSRRHPRFRRVTIERLVARTADGFRWWPLDALVPAVRREAGFPDRRYCVGFHVAGGGKAGWEIVDRIFAKYTGGPYPQREDRGAFLVEPVHVVVPTFG